ncbi:MAG TPA: mechanosensitive ion channel family protein [Desulfobacteraceae bacterium]|nr:mechanosensitive ion channel family protein [Desulfobacteraceae bacterium]
MYYFRIGVVFILLFSFTAVNVKGADTGIKKEVPAGETDGRQGSSLDMLESVVELQDRLSSRIAEKRARLSKSGSETEQRNLEAELSQLDKQLDEISRDFERIATGIDTSLFGKKKTESFDWKDEILSLVKPGIMEVKRLTLKARKKAKLKEEISQYEQLLPVAETAIENISQLASKTEDKALKEKLNLLLPEWQGVQGQLESNYKITSMQLAKMEQGEKSFVETSQETVKKFFRTRGLFLFLAVAACLAVGFVLRLFYRLLMQAMPGRSAQYRPFYLRALDLGYRVLALVLTLFTIMFVFYMAEDWVLLSLTILLILGVVWAVKHTVPKMWHQGRLMLNIGAVREGERILLHGVPWLVKEIHLFCRLENPSMGITLRLPIEELLDKVSRPVKSDEPWFPCRKNDWVILADNTRGKVTQLSHEMVELVQRGGARKTYQTGDFLANSPLNLSRQFRIKVYFGIDYDLQKESTGAILTILSSCLEERLEQEGYRESLLNLRVEFESAGDSSLGLVVIADFKGEMAPLYERLRRAIQRWCVDACTENGWNIPFPQLTVNTPGKFFEKQD